MARDRFRGMGDAIPKKSKHDIINNFRDIIKDFEHLASKVEALNDGSEEAVIPIEQTQRSAFSWE